MKRILDNVERNERTLLCKINQNDVDRLQVICDRLNLSQTKVIKYLIDKEFNNSTILSIDSIIISLESLKNNNK